MTIIEFAKEERDARLRQKSEWDFIINLCRRQGYYIIPDELFESAGSQVVVTVHGYPDTVEDGRYMHRHDFFELIYVYQGTYCSRMEDRDIIMNTGDMLLLNTNVLHSPYLRSENDIVFNILLSKQLVHDQLIPLLASNEVLFPFFYNCLHSGTPTKESILFQQIPKPITAIADQLIDEYANRAMYYQHTVSVLMVLLLLRLSREYYQSHAVNKSSADDAVFEQLLHDYLNQHLASATLADAAKKLTYTPAYLSRKVRQQTGITFSELVSDYRINKACELLQTTDLSLDAIAKAIGYVNASHFIRKFKERINMTPGDYRKQEGDLSSPGIH